MSLFDDERTTSRENGGPERRIMDSILEDIFPTFYEFYISDEREKIPVGNADTVNLFSGNIDGIEKCINAGFKIKEEQRILIMEVGDFNPNNSVYKGDAWPLGMIKDIRVINFYELNNRVTLLNNLIQKRGYSEEVAKMLVNDLKFLEILKDIKEVVEKGEKL